MHFTYFYHTVGLAGQVGIISVPGLMITVQ